MHPHEFDGVNLLVLDGEIGSSQTRVLAQGRGAFDGQTFEIVGSNGEAFMFPEGRWDEVPVPVTGRWKTQYPEAEFYFVFHSPRER